MTFTIAFGWWIAPAIVTAAAFAWAIHMQQPNRGGDYNFTPLFNALWFVVAAVPSLAAWLIWSLLT